MGQNYSTEGFNYFNQEELKLLYFRFLNLDDNANGQIELEEFYKVSELKQNPLVKRVFTILDTDKSGSIDFNEFISGIGPLYTNNEEAKIKFCFQVYDLDDDGFISNGDLFSTMQMMVGQNLSEIQLQELVDRTIIRSDEDFDGKISYDEFKKIVKDLDLSNKLTIDQINNHSPQN